MSMEIKNAVIESATFDTDRGMLSAFVSLDFGGACQGFGGYVLYAPAGWKAHEHQGNFCGHFIWRVLEVADASDWSKLKGRTVRVMREDGMVQAIGHIIKDDWFNPSAEFKALAARKDTPDAE